MNNNIKKQNILNDSLDSLEKLKKAKILIIGETIIDEYVFCEGIGKSSKDPFLILKDLYSKKYIGGAAMVAKNLSNFGCKVTYLSNLSKKFQYRALIKNNLGKNINSYFINKKNSPTII